MRPKTEGGDAKNKSFMLQYCYFSSRSLHSVADGVLLCPHRGFRACVSTVEARLCSECKLQCLAQPALSTLGLW